MNGNFKAIILDMDGVITQTAKVHARAWKQMFDDFLRQQQTEGAVSDTARLRPFDVDRDYKQYVDGKPRYEGVESFLASREINLPYGAEDDPADTRSICGLGNRKNAIFHELLTKEGVDVYDDAVQQLDQWKRLGLRLGVISSSRNCQAVLEAADLLDRFDVKVDGNDLKRHDLRGKPAPDMFQFAARQLDVDPADAIVAEDAIAGVQAARQGHFGQIVGVVRQGRETDLHEAGADIVVRDLRQVDVHRRGSRCAVSRTVSKFESWRS